MAYKYSTGSLRQGDIYFEDDRLGEPTYIDFGMDTISLRPSGSAILNASASAVGIGTTSPDYTLDVAGNIGLDEYIYHNGDADTFIRFQDDDITIKAGNVNFIKLSGSDSQDKLICNDGRADLDFIIRSPNETLALYLNADNEVLHVNHGESAFKTKIHSTNGEAITVNDSGVIFNEDGAAANDLRVESDNDTHLFFIDGGADRVGIGTSSPASTLGIAGTVTVAGYVTSSTGYQGFLTDADNDTYITVEAADDEDKVRIFTGGNQRMMLRNSDEAVAISDNNVGDFTPLALLHVSGAGAGGDQLFIVGGGSADKPNALVVDQNGQVGVGDFTGNSANPLLSLSVSGTLGVYKTDSTTTSQAESRFILDCTRGSGHDTVWKVGSYYHSDSLHKFRIAEANTNIVQIIEGAAANCVYIDESSNVGIGTNSPKVKLDVLHDPTSLADDTGGGEVVTFGGEDDSDTLAAGKLMYLHSGGDWKYADSDAVATSGAVLLGIALGTAVSDGILLRGYFDATAIQGSFVKGGACYISETAGAIDFTAPSASGDVVRVVGYGTDTANVIYFNPSGTWIEIS